MTLSSYKVIFIRELVIISAVLINLKSVNWLESRWEAKLFLDVITISSSSEIGPVVIKGDAYETREDEYMNLDADYAHASEQDRRQLSSSWFYKRLWSTRREVFGSLLTRKLWIFITVMTDL